MLLSLTQHNSPSMWSFLDLRPAKVRPKMHLSAFTDSEVEDKQILHIKSEQMLPEIPDLITFYLFITSLKLYHNYLKRWLPQSLTRAVKDRNGTNHSSGFW